MEVITVTPNRSNLELLMYAAGITNETIARVINAKSTKTVYNKVHHIYDFSLPEAMAIKDNLFPEYTLDYIFDGYSELKPV